MAYTGKIETERLIIRPTEYRDVDDVYEYMSDPEVMRYRACGVQSKEVVGQTVRKIVDSGRRYTEFVGKVHQIVLRMADKVIGYCYLDFPWSEGYRELMPDGRTDFVDLTYGLTRKYWGNGYATEAAQVILHYGFQCANVEKVGAAVNPENKPSIRVLQRCGFMFRRKFPWPKQGLVDFYSLSRSEYEQLIANQQ